MALRAVLWDADGVLQTTPTCSWAEASVVVAEIPDALVGGAVTESAVREVHARLGLPGDIREVLAVWSRFTVLEQSLDVVADVRAAGVPCFLATNQDALRAGAMRRLTAYDDVLDGCYYSCDLGVAKPDPAYFAAVLADLGLAPRDVLFVDDRAVNVVGARGAGLHAFRWAACDGIAALRDLLTPHGVLG